MIRLLQSTVLALAVFLPASLSGAMAQTSVPDDFSLSIASRPTHLYDDIDVMQVWVEADGATRINAFRYAGEGGEVRPAMTLDMPADDVAALWRRVEEADFFNQPEEIINYRISGGDQAIFTVTANGRTHTVTTINMPVEVLDNIAASLNGRLPASHRLYYNALFYPDMLLAPDGQP